MNTKNRDVIFFDLDDTLIATYYTKNDTESLEIRRNIPDYYCISNIHHDVGCSTIVCRPWAQMLIQQCVDLVGPLNVAILTRNTSGFVDRLMYRVNFQINQDRIYTAEDFYYKYSIFENTNNILVDDGSYDYHNHGLMSKVNFLNLKRQNLIQVPPFNPIGIDIDPDDGWKPILKQIKKVLKTKQ